MPDYKEMYLHLMHETEQALRLTAQANNLLIKAQQDCEDMLLNAPDPPLILLDPTEEPGKD